jgi:hypothetical protein
MIGQVINLAAFLPCKSIPDPALNIQILFSIREPGTTNKAATFAVIH